MNGYPPPLVNKIVNKKIESFSEQPKHGSSRCPIYVKLPWIGPEGQSIGDKISLPNCFLYKARFSLFL